MIRFIRKNVPLFVLVVLAFLLQKILFDDDYRLCIERHPYWPATQVRRKGCCHDSYVEDNTFQGQIDTL